MLQNVLIKYLHPADHNSAKIRKFKKGFARELNFKDIKCAVKIRDIYKIKKMYILASVFLLMKTRKNIQSVCQKIL